MGQALPQQEARGKTELRIVQERRQTVRELLAPWEEFRRVIPLIGGVDLSPIALFLLLQVALSALAMVKLMLIGVA